MKTHLSLLVIAGNFICIVSMAQGYTKPVTLSPLLGISSVYMESFSPEQILVQLTANEVLVNNNWINLDREIFVVTHKKNLYEIEYNDPRKGSFKFSVSPGSLIFSFAHKEIDLHKDALTRPLSPRAHTTVVILSAVLKEVLAHQPFEKIYFEAVKNSDEISGESLLLFFSSSRSQAEVKTNTMSASLMASLNCRLQQLTSYWCLFDKLCIAANRRSCDSLPARPVYNLGWASFE